MASFLVPFSNVIPKSFNLLSQPDSTSSATSAALPPLPAATSSQAVSRAARPSVPPGFNARASRAPLVPPGFAPLRPNTHHVAQPTSSFVPANAGFGPSVSGQAYQTASQAMFGQLQVLREGLETMHKDLTWLKRQSKRQAGTLTWTMLGPDEYKKTKNAVANLEADVSQLIKHTQGQDRKITNLKDRVGIVQDDNRELRKDIGSLKQELGHLRRVVKYACVGGYILGGAAIVGGIVSFIKRG